MIRTRSCSASSARARARWSRRCCGGCCCSGAARSCSTSSASTAPCARRSGSSRSRSSPAASIRLNPLASRPEEHAQLELLRAVTVTAVGGPLTQVEAAGLREALARGARERRGRTDPAPDRPGAVRPDADMADRLRTTAEQLALDVRRAALALQDLCEGPLKGMFDGPTTPGARPRREAARARPARGQGLAGGRHPDGLRHRVDERAAGPDGRAARPRAADQRRRRVLEDRAAHRARRVVSVELQAGPPVRGDEPGRAAQAGRPERRGRCRLTRGADRRGAGGRRLDPHRLPPGREPGAADPERSSACPRTRRG